MHLDKIANIFNWDDIAKGLLTTVSQLIVLTVVFIIINKVGGRIIRSYVNMKDTNKSEKNNKFGFSHNKKRSKTILALLNSVFNYTVIFFYLFGVLSILGVPVGTLLASAGIFSLALGMGAQGFVSDLVNGFFILSEGQFDVGDTVQLANNTGQVVQFGLRSTTIKDSDGRYVYIPNRNITIVQNLSREGWPVSIELTVDYLANHELVMKTISEALNDAKTKISQKHITSPAVNLGIRKQTGTSVTYLVYLKVKPGTQSRITGQYYKILIEALKKARIPFGN